MSMWWKEDLAGYQRRSFVFNRPRDFPFFICLCLDRRERAVWLGPLPLIYGGRCWAGRGKERERERERHFDVGQREVLGRFPKIWRNIRSPSAASLLGGVSATNRGVEEEIWRQSPSSISSLPHRCPEPDWIWEASPEEQFRCESLFFVWRCRRNINSPRTRYYY